MTPITPFLPSAHAASEIYFHQAFSGLPVPHGESWALFLDIDGTISDIAPSPEKAFIPAEFLLLLASVHDKPLSLISGRAIPSIDAITRPFRFAAAGQHGFEIRDHRGQTVTTKAINKIAYGEIVRGVERLAQENPGLRMEPKGAGIAVHYRSVPEKQGLVMDCLEHLASRYKNDFYLQHGKMVGELRPRGVDKGTAIEFFMRSAPFAGKRPVFIGDDETDEAGFAAVNASGGISIKVGEGETRAAYRANSPAEIRSWLGNILPFFNAESERTVP